MICPDFHNQVQSLLDGDTVGFDEAARHHVKQCTACRDLSIAAELLRTLAHEPEIMPPAGFADRVVTLVLVLRERGRQVRLRWWSVSAAAAAILLAIGLWSLRDLLTLPPGAAEVVKKLEDPPRMDASAPPSFTQAREVGRLALERSRQAAEDAARQASILMPPTSELTTPHLTVAMDRADVPIGDVGKSVSDGLEPVTKSTRRAFDAWLNLLPMGGDEKPGT